MLEIRKAITADRNGVIVGPIRIRPAMIPIIGHLTRRILITLIRRYGIRSTLGFLDTTVRITDLIEVTIRIMGTLLTRMSIGGITVAVGMFHSRGVLTLTEVRGEVKADVHGVHGVWPRRQSPRTQSERPQRRTRNRNER